MDEYEGFFVFGYHYDDFLDAGDGTGEFLVDKQGLGYGRGLGPGYGIGYGGWDGLETGDGSSYPVDEFREDL